MKLIAIVGKKRSGKDTCADYVVENLNGIKYQLADTIKNTLADAWSVFDGDNMYKQLNILDWHGRTDFDREQTLIINNKNAANVLHRSIDILIGQYGLRLTDNDGTNVKRSKIVDNVTINNSEPWTIRRFMQTLGTDLVVNEFDRMFWMKLFAKEYCDSFGKNKDYFVVPDVRQTHEIEMLRAMGATIIHVVRSETADIEDTHITELGLPIHETDSVIFNDGSVEDLYTSLKEILK